MRSVSGSRARITLLAITVIATLIRGGDYCFSGEPGDSLVIAGGFGGASSFCVTPSGTIYVLEGARDLLVKVSPSGKREAETGGFGWGDGGFDRPGDVTATDDLELFVADGGNDRIVRLDRTLGLSSVFETRTENVTFRFPLSVALTEFGKLLIVDGENGRIVELGKDDRVTRVFGGVGSGGNFLRSPTKVRTDGNERVVVRDRQGLVIFDAYGNHLGTIPAGRTGAFIAFDVGDDGITLLDTSAVRLMTKEGGQAARVDLPASTGAPVPVDVRAAGPSVFVLYPDRIVRLPGWRPDPRRPGAEPDTGN